MRNSLLAFILTALPFLISSANAASKVKKGNIAKIHYNTYAKELRLLESSFNSEPTILLLDKKKDLSKLEEGIIGMKVGEERKIEVAAKDAFGEYDKSNVVVVKRKDITLPEGSKLVLGKFINVNSTDADGNEITRPLRVIKLDDENVTFDLNHVYAGKDLVYEVRLEDTFTEKEFKEYQAELAKKAKEEEVSESEEKAIPPNELKE